MENSSLWTNEESYNVENGLKSFYENEAKFPAFSKIPFDEICIGMKVANNVSWLKTTLENKTQQESLRSIFKAGNELKVAKGRALWKGLIANSSLQQNCNKKGFNMKCTDDGSIIARLGFIANNESDCNTCDSGIGLRFFAHSPISCGNLASLIYPPTGSKDIPAMCFILIK